MPISALTFIPDVYHADIKARTSTVDLTQYLQTFFDFVSTNSEQGYIPSGLYNISDPIWVARTKQPSGFYTSNVYGAGGGYVDILSQTTIVANHLDGPALMIQRARGVRLSGICIQGENRFTIPDRPSTDQADYLAPGVRANRFSPHCGIAIDPTLGDPPDPADQYPGLESEYLDDVGGSKNTWLSDISIRNFAVGIVVSPTSSVQAEMTVLRDCGIGQCDIGASYGQPQSRANSIYTTDFEFCRIAISTFDHGNQNGALQNVDSCQFVEIQTGFNSTPNKGVKSFSNCYYEVVNEIVDGGGGFTQILAPLTFNSCEFRITPDPAFNGQYWPIIARSRVPVVFNECWFADNSVTDVKAMNFAATANTAHFEFNGCQFWGAWDVNALAAIGVQRDNAFTVPLDGNSLFNNCWIMSNEESPPYRVVSETAEFTRAVVLLNGTWTFTDDDLFVTALDPTEAAKLSVGQLIFWETLASAVPAMEVTLIDGLNITCRLLFKRENYDESPPWLPIDRIEALILPRTDA